MTTIVPVSIEGQEWLRAKKTASIRAKPMVTLIIDRSVASKFLVDTLEGREPIHSDNMFCIGAAGDAWQQSSKALLKKYAVIEVDKEGWMICEPRPENEIEFHLSTADGYVRGMWGETIGDELNLQRVKVGDSIARQPHDHTDVWVVRKTLFQNTYTVLGK